MDFVGISYGDVIGFRRGDYLRVHEDFVGISYGDFIRISYGDFILIS